MTARPSIIRRLLTRWQQRREARAKEALFLARWDAAISSCWMILQRKPASRERFNRFQRHHDKLCTIIRRRAARIQTEQRH
jgi:hypothetical protein